MTTSREAELALLAAGAYWDIRGKDEYLVTERDESNHAPLPEGWIVLTDKDSLKDLSASGASAEPFGSGFSVRTYQNTKTKEIVISFAGTEFGFDNGKYGMLNDFVSGNIPLAFGLTSEQAYLAALYYQKIAEKYTGSNIIFTGHSLGGGLASLMAVWFDRPVNLVH